MKVYNLTGIKNSELINVMSTSNNGRELIFYSTELIGIEAGDTILMDRPYHKNVPFRAEGVRYLPEQPLYTIVYAKLIEEQLGGCQTQLRLRYRKSR